jgi:hypothetical protein
MTNIIRATWNRMKLERAVRQPWSKKIVPMLLLREEADDFSGSYNKDLVERVNPERRYMLKKFNCYAQGHLIVPSDIHVRMDGAASRINVRYGGVVRDGVVKRDKSIEGWENFDAFLGQTAVYSGFLEIMDGLKRIAYFGEKALIDNFSVDLMPQVAEWYADFMRKRKD